MFKKFNSTYLSCKGTRRKSLDFKIRADLILMTQRLNYCTNQDS